MRSRYRKSLERAELRQRPAVRPSLPWIASFALVFWVVLAGTLMVLIEDMQGSQAFLAAGAAGCLASGVCLARFRNLASLLAFAAASGVLVASVHAASIMSVWERVQDEPACEREFRLTEDPRTSFGGMRAAAITTVAGKEVKVRLHLPAGFEGRFGSVVASSDPLRPPSEVQQASCLRAGCLLVGTIEADGCRFVEARGVLGAVSGFRTERLEQLERLESDGWMSDAPGWVHDGLMVVKAVLFGERTELLDSDVYQDMKAAGLAHLVAVSGAHLAIVAGFLGIFVKALGLPRRWAFALQVAFLGLYVVLVGLPLSCLRAAAMSLIVMTGGLGCRRSSSLSALGLVAVAFLLFDPSAALSASFLLSCLATAGIVAFMPLFAAWLRQGWAAALPDAVRDPVAMTLAATLTTLPVSLSLFAQFPVLAPLSNIVAGPVLSFVCAVGLLSVFLTPLPCVSDLLFSACAVAAGGLNAVVHGLTCLPFCCLPVDAEGFLETAVVVLACAGLWVAWPSARALNRIVAGALAVVAAFALASPLWLDRSPRLVMLDVGQGDALLLTDGRASVLVDTGNRDADLLAGLGRHGVRRLDAVVVTHPDDDHCGSLSALRGVCPVEQVLVAKGMDEIDEKKCSQLLQDAERTASQGVGFLEVGDELRVGVLRCTVVAPSALEHEAGNEDSICLRVEADVDADGLVDAAALLTGDAEHEVLERLQDQGALGKVDLLKVGHHGSRKALSPELVERLDPAVGLVSCGEGNRYGHPTKRTLDLLHEQGATIVRTDLNGDAVCRFTAEGVEVRVERPADGEALLRAG